MIFIKWVVGEGFDGLGCIGGSGVFDKGEAEGCAGGGVGGHVDTGEVFAGGEGADFAKESSDDFG